MSQRSGPNNTARILCIFTMETSVVSVQNYVIMLAFELAQLVVIVVQHGMMPHGQNNTATILPMEASIVSVHITK